MFSKNALRVALVGMPVPSLGDVHRNNNVQTVDRVYLPLGHSSYNGKRFLKRPAVWKMERYSCEVETNPEAAYQAHTLRE